jgi:hypothetical protein
MDRPGHIPSFREDGYLPDGIFLATEPEITFRFGTATSRRRKLVLRLRRWIQLARQIGALRLCIDGSFITAKPDPNDIDAVVLLPHNFNEQIAADSPPKSLPQKTNRIGTIGLNSSVELAKRMGDAEVLWR